MGLGRRGFLRRWGIKRTTECGCEVVCQHEKSSLMTRVCPAHLPGVELVVQAVRQSPTPRLPPANKICEEPCPPPRSDMCGYNISVSHPLFFLSANDPSSLFHYSALALLILSCSLIINRYVLLSYTRTYSYSVYVYRILRGPVGISGTD